MTLPRISLITAAYNRRAHVAHCLASVAEQDHPDIEHIVIDGASTDGTYELFTQHRHRLTHLVSEPDGGVYDAINKGLRLAQGEVVGFLHTDDFFAAPDVLSSVAQVFLDPTVMGVYGDLEYVARDNPARVIRYWRAGTPGRLGLSLGWMPPHPTLFVRRSVYDAVGGFDTRFRIAADYHSVLRMFTHPNFNARYLPRVLTCMRVGGISNHSVRARLRKSQEDWQVLRESGVGGLTTVLFKNLRKLPHYVKRGPKR